MKLRILAASAAALIGLTACSAEVPIPEITMVGGKLCALADKAGWDDEGLNRETFVALQKAKVALGIALDVDQVAASGTHASAQKRLSEFATGGCSLVISSGDFLTADVNVVATAHPEVQFVTTDHHFESSAAEASSHTMILSNVHSIANQLGQAAFEAGYLAAMSSKTHVVATLIAIGSPKVSLQSKLANAFAKGVGYFETHSGVTTKLIATYPVPKIAPASEAIRQTVSGLYNQGVDRLFVLSAKDFETVATVTEPFTNLQLIGSELDWALRSTTSKYASRILASVVRTKNVSSLYDFIAFWLAGHTATPGPNAIDVNSLTNDGVALTDAHSIAYPAEFSNQINQLVEQLTSEQGMTQ